jgi:hypothetical protein
MKEKSIKQNIRDRFYDIFDSCRLVNGAMYYLDNEEDLGEFIKKNYRRLNLNSIPLKKWFYIEDVGCDDYPDYQIILIEKRIKDCIEISKDAMMLSVLFQLEIGEDNYGK